MRRRVGERAATLCITPTVKHGGGTFMIWETFINCKDRYLHQVKGKLNQTGYHSILQYHAIWSGMQLVGQGFVFIQDNDPKHTRKLCQKYIKSKKGTVPLWSNASPISRLKSHWTGVGFDRKVRAKQRTSAAHLWQLLPKSWVELSSVYLQSLESIPRICEAVIATKEGQFDEWKV